MEADRGPAGLRLQEDKSQAACHRQICLEEVQEVKVCLLDIVP